MKSSPRPKSINNNSQEVYSYQILEYFTEPKRIFVITMN